MMSGTGVEFARSSDAVEDSKIPSEESLEDTSGIEVSFWEDDSWIVEIGLV
tara:strand:- start:357 stop:509 length:153 start_codon:yes stop_codon:yes gene_type:complete